MQCPDPTHQLQPVAAFSAGELDFRKCPECGLVFRHTFPSDKELSALYEGAYGEQSIVGGLTNQESTEFATQAHLAFLLGHVLVPEARVLDFGAGSGGLTSLFRDAGVNADGFEPTPDARAYCLQNRGIRLLGDPSEIPRAAYDVVTMIEVIEHLADLNSTLTGVRKCLKPGGTLFITTPNRKGWRAIMEGGNWREARKKFHLFLFDESSLAHHLKRHGFEDIRRVRFSPVVGRGTVTRLLTRCLQAAGLSGGLCMLVK